MAVCGLRDLHIDHRPLVKIEVVGSGVEDERHIAGKEPAVPVIFESVGLRTVNQLFQLFEFCKSFLIRHSRFHLS